MSEKEVDAKLSDSHIASNEALQAAKCCVEMKVMPIGGAVSELHVYCYDDLCEHESQIA